MLRATPLLVCLAACQPGWSDALDGVDPGALSGVWGSGPDDVWAVGGSDFDTAVTLRWDGAAWSEVTPPPTPLLAWVYGWGPDDALAVGVGGAAARWDGSTWNVLDSGTDADLWGVWGRGSDDAWIVGGVAGGAEPTLLHWDGAALTPVALEADQNPRQVGQIFKVWGIGSRTFAVGERGALWTYDAGAWTAIGGGAEATQDFVSLWGTAQDRIVAVGGRGNARIARWDGTAWDTLAPSGIGGLNAVTMIDDDTAVIGGVSGFVGSFDVDSGEVTAEAGLGSLDVHAAWHDGQGVVWAVGGRFAGTLSGLLWRRD